MSETKGTDPATLPKEPPPPANPPDSVYTPGDPVAVPPEQLPPGFAGGTQEDGEVSVQGLRTVCARDVYVRYCPDGTSFGYLLNGDEINAEKYSAGYAYGYCYGCVNAKGWVQEAALC